jgi:hypothetical protein
VPRKPELFKWPPADYVQYNDVMQVLIFEMEVEENWGVEAWRLCMPSLAVRTYYCCPIVRWYMQGLIRLNE